MTNTLLDKIIAVKRRRVEDEKRRIGVSELAKAGFTCRKDAVPNRFSSSISSRTGANIIAEIKRASPSKGVINDSFDVARLANAYERGGAAAISVLTEEAHFRGSIEDLKRTRSEVDLPVLQKDFIVDEFQVFESATAGADAILLIVAALSTERLIALQKIANDLGMDAMVEVHDSDELDVAGGIGAKIIGVNNRDLKTFDVSLDVSRELVASAPKDALLISESGISTVEQIVELRDLGYSGFLIGESLMRSDDPEAKLRELAAIETGVIEYRTTQ